MKSQYSLSVLVLIFCAFAFSSGKSAPTSISGSANNPDSSSVPPEVHKIMVNSCLACHGEGGKAIALSKVKMSEWSAYSPEKQASKSEDMCNMVTKGKMPTKGFLKDHPEAALTAEQIATICNWSAELNKGK
jgi:cytochrome c553